MPHTFAVLLVPLPWRVNVISHIAMHSSSWSKGSGNLQGIHLGLSAKKYGKVTGKLTKHSSTDEILLILNSILFSLVTVLLISTELEAPKHPVNDVWHRALDTDAVSFPQKPPM